MRWSRPAIIAILLLAFGLRAYHLGFQSIWTDEGFIVGLASRNLPDLVAIWNISPQDGYASLSRVGQDLVGLAVETDMHPPLYYFLIHSWMPLAGQSEFALRFPAAFFGVLTLPLLYVVGRRMIGVQGALLGCAIAALSPFYLDFSQQVRMYTLMTFLALLSIYSFHRAFKDGRSIHWPIYAVSTSLALYTHYFAITILLVQALLAVLPLLTRWWRRSSALALGISSSPAQPLPQTPADRALARGDLRRFGLWLAASMGAAVLLAPWVPFALRQVFDYQNRSLLTPDWQVVFAKTWQTFNLGVSVDSSQATPVLLAMLVVFLLGLGLALWRGVAERPGMAVLLAYFIAPLLVGLVIFRFKPMFHPKYFMMASPAYYLLLGAGLFALRRSLRWLALPFGLFLLVALAYGVNSYLFDTRYWKDDTRALGAYLESRTTERDLVISDLIEPLGYYYRGPAPAYYLPGDTGTAPERLARLGQGSERVFLVHYEHSYTDSQGLIPFLLERASDRVTEKGFRGYSLREYVLRPGASFGLDAAASMAGVSFGDRVVLEGALIGGEGISGASGTPAVASAGRVWAALDWRVQPPAAGDYKASLSLVDGRGHLAAQKDSPIMRGMDPTSRWLPGERARNYYTLPIFSGVAPGEYQLRLTVYESAQSEAAGASRTATRYLGDEVNLGNITVGAPRLAVEFSSREMGSPSRAPLGPIEGLGYTLNNRREYRPGDIIPLTLFMTAPKPVGQDLRLRFQLWDSAGVSHMQWDSSPLYPTSRWRSGDGVRDWQDLQLPARLAAGEYRLVMGLVPASGVTQGLPWDLGTIQVLDRPRVFTPPAMSHPLQAASDGKIALLGYNFEGDLRPGATLSLTLYWKALAPMDESYAIFAHLLDQQSHIWAQHDGMPGGDIPTTGWFEGEVITDKHSLTVKNDAPPGEYTLEVGAYEPRSGRRVAISTAGVRVVDQALWLQSLQLK